MNPRVTAIIPAHNEEETIAHIVRVTLHSPLVDEVVVVSDGSLDRTVEEARNAGARVLEVAVKGGKGPALQRGVRNTDAPILLFLDADLRGLREDHIELLLRPVLNGSRKMNIGLRDRGRIMRMLGPRLLLVSGERALMRDVFEVVPDEHLKGYMVEASLNFACRSRKWAYGSVFMSGLTIRTKFEKVRWKALPQYGRMWWQVLTAFWMVRVAYASGRVDELKTKVNLQK